jgi:uncharacterized protein YciI
MAHFIVEYADLPDVEQARASNRAAHIAYRVGLGERMLMAGPLLDDAASPVGSLVLIAANDLAEAKSIAASDPFVRSSVFRLISVRPYRIAALLGKQP